MVLSHCPDKDYLQKLGMPAELNAWSMHTEKFLPPKCIVSKVLRSGKEEWDVLQQYFRLFDQ
jgi:hypothetical protein